MDTSEFVIGQRWVSHSDTALGLGIVTDISGRRVTLGFPAADEERTYAIDNAPLSRIIYQIGEAIETFDGERYIVRAVEDIGGVLMYHADDGGENLNQVSEVKLSSSVDFSAPTNGCLPASLIATVRFACGWPPRNTLTGCVHPRLRA